jgi:hypothetical protein
MEIVAAMPTRGMSRRRQQAERIHHHMCGGPDGFDGESRYDARQLPCREARKARKWNAASGTLPHCEILLGSSLASWNLMSGLRPRLHCGSW